MKGLLVSSKSIIRTLFAAAALGSFGLTQIPTYAELPPVSGPVIM